MQAESLKRGNSPGVSPKPSKAKRGFPNATKNEKKDRNHSSEKIPERSKKALRNVVKQKKGGSPCNQHISRSFQSMVSLPQTKRLSQKEM